MSIFVQDTFTDTNATALEDHTGEIGATWTSVGAGTLQIITSPAGAAQAVSTAGYYYASGVPGNADYDIEAIVRLSGSTGEPVGVIGRWDPIGNSSYAFFYNPDAFGYNLTQTVSGSGSTLLSSVQGTNSGNPVTLKLQMRGTTISVFHDIGSGYVQLGTDVTGDVTDAGLVGILTGGTFAMIDSLTATDTYTPPPPTAANNLYFRRRR